MKDEREKLIIWFFHEKGYDYFTMNKLSVAEFNLLVEAYNYVETKKELMSKNKR